MTAPTTTAAPPLHEGRTLRGVMGGRGTIQVLADDRDHGSWLVAVATARLAELEDRWSRFVDTSDITRMSDSSGEWVAVSAETIDVLALAIDARVATRGRFDPTVGSDLVALGYDRTFDEVVARPPTATPPGAPGRDRAPAVRPALEIDVHRRVARVQPGCRLDLGGIGKGRAADVVTDELVDLGARGACIELGGDLAVRGIGPHDGAWSVSVADALDPDDAASDVAVLRLAHGGVATSTTLGRRWAGPAGVDRHHLVDPATGCPAESGLVAVTAVAATAAWAEVLATAALVAGLHDGRALVEDAGVAALLTTADGRRTAAGPLADLTSGGLR